MWNSCSRHHHIQSLQQTCCCRFDPLNPALYPGKPFSRVGRLCKPLPAGVNHSFQKKKSLINKFYYNKLQLAWFGLVRFNKLSFFCLFIGLVSQKAALFIWLRQTSCTPLHTHSLTQLFLFLFPSAWRNSDMTVNSDHFMGLGFWACKTMIITSVCETNLHADVRHLSKICKIVFGKKMHHFDQPITCLHGPLGLSGGTWETVPSL